MDKAHVVVLGHGPDVDVMTGVLSSSREWEVSNHVLEGGLVDVIVIAGEDGTDSSQIMAYKDQHPELLILSSRSMLHGGRLWPGLEAHVDDLFDSPEELMERLPFLLKRISLRKARRQQFEAIFDNAVDAIVIINHSGIITRFNKAAEKVFQYEYAEVKGRNVSMLMPESYARNHDSYISNYLETGIKKVLGIGREVEGQRKNGDVFPMELALSEFSSEGKPHFAGFVRDISERRKLEHEILRTSEHERRRVGQDLHDGLGQMLTGISLIAGNLARRLTMQSHALADDLTEVVELIRDADRMTRTIARGLVPVELDGEGLSAAIEGLCVNARKLFSVDCRFVQEGVPSIRDSSAVSNFYRIAQESISNAVKHGRATRIDVALVEAGRTLTLSITDNGVGFPETLGPDRGMGVDIMGYRARVINARLSIYRRTEGGTVVSCVLTYP